MYPQSHFLFSLVVGLLFVKFGIINYSGAIYVALVGFFVDVDHYLTFIFRYKLKDFSFRDAWNRAVKGLYAGRSFIHHEIGFVLISFALVLIFFANRNLFWIFALGYYSHMLLDFGHFNILKIKEKMTFREEGFIMKINKFEVLLDIFLVVAVVLLVL